MKKLSGRDCELDCDCIVEFNRSQQKLRDQTGLYEVLNNVVIF